MDFGKTLGTACSTFAITNIDNLFVLVTFFAESGVNKGMTPLKITIGQYLGFTVIMIISMIGYAVAQAIPSEPIGFLGLLPILLGVWKSLDVIFPNNITEEAGTIKTTGMRCLFKVASITVMNGGDNIGTYIPLFSQAKGAEIAVYAITYYILLGVWCFIGFLIIKQKRVVEIAEKYARYVVPLLYIGLGIFIIVKSQCYPWSIEHINERFMANPGVIILSIMTTFLLSACISTMVTLRLRKLLKKRRAAEANQDLELQPTTAGDSADRRDDVEDKRHQEEMGHIANEQSTCTPALGIDRDRDGIAVVKSRIT